MTSSDTTQKLESLEQVLQDSWNGNADIEKVGMALDDALHVIREQAYAYATITSVVVRAVAPPFVRAVLRQDPGTRPRLMLEYVDYGPESLPIVVKRCVEVEHDACVGLGGLRFEGERLLFLKDPEMSRNPALYGVVATAQCLDSTPKSVHSGTLSTHRKTAR